MFHVEQRQIKVMKMPEPERDQPQPERTHYQGRSKPIGKSEGGDSKNGCR